ncbi:hypothetical protein NMG60_11024549 [Bertholletia excelsa]
MKVTLILSLLLLCFGDLANGLSGNFSSRPDVVNIGAILAFNSTIGRVAKIAIEQAVKDVNSNSSILPGTKLVVEMKNSSCNAFLGTSEALQFMKTDIIAIIGPQSSVVAHLASHITSSFQVPQLSFAATDPSLSPMQFPFFVRTTQSDLYQMTAVADIVDYYGWKQVTAIFIDDDYGRNGVAALDDALAARQSKLTHKMGITSSSEVSREKIMSILIKVALLESRVIVLHTYPDLGFMVSSVAHYLGMMSEGYAWIATDWLSSVLDSSPSLPSEKMETLQGVLVLRQHTPNSDRKGAFFSRWNQLTGGSLGLNTYGLYAYDTVWLVAHALDSFFNQDGVISFSNDSENNRFFKGVPLFDGGTLLLNKILESDFVGLTGPIKFDTDRNLGLPAYDVVSVIGTGLRMIGYWSNHSGLSTLPPEILYPRPTNESKPNQQLHSVIWPGETMLKPRGWVFPNNGEVLRIGVPISVSFKEFVSQVKSSNTFQGFCIDVFESALDLLPYAVPYQFIPYGDGKKTPSYTELVNLVAAGYFDAAVGDIAVITSRSKIVAFTQPYIASGLVVVAPFRKLNTGSWAFLRPFSPALWVTIAALVFLIGVGVWVLEHRVNDEFRGSPKEQLMTILWFSFSTLCFAHRKREYHEHLGRMVLLVWLFVVLIINSSYTANLTSILLVQHLSSPVRGIESLKTINDPIGYLVGSFTEQYLNEEIGIPKSRLVPLLSAGEYATALQKGPEKGGVAAVVDERPYIEHFLSRHCNYRIVGQDFTKSGWGFAFPRDSPLAVDISTAILTLSENGDLQRIHDEWLTQSTCNLESAEIESDHIHVKSFLGLYLIFAITSSVALIIYFLRITCGFQSAAQLKSVPNREGISRSRRLKNGLPLFDKRRSHFERETKRRKVERWSSSD